jgi:hypothetical protein
LTPETWAKARPLIKRALKYSGGTHTPEDVFDAITSGGAQLWCGAASVIVTQIVVYPRLKACRIWLAGGDMAELTETMLPDVEAWAKAKGCKRMQVVGRKGWARVLRDYREPSVVLEKEIEH